MKKQSVFLLIFFIILFLQGCGRKGPPVAPPEEAVYGKPTASVLHRN